LRLEKFTPGGVGSVFASGLNQPLLLAFTDDAGHPLLLANQVPEPSTLALGIAGLAGLAVFRWRRQHPPSHVLADADCIRTSLIKPANTFDAPRHGLAGHARQPDRRNGNGGLVPLTHVCVGLAGMDRMMRATAWLVPDSHRFFDARFSCRKLMRFVRIALDLTTAAKMA
jgi:hypothetical protein